MEVLRHCFHSFKNNPRNELTSQNSFFVRKVVHVWDTAELSVQSIGTDEPQVMRKQVMRQKSSMWHTGAVGGGNHLISLGAGSQYGLPHRLLGTVAEHNLVGSIREPVVLLKFRTDGLAQRCCAGIGCVPGDTFPAQLQSV